MIWYYDNTFEGFLSAVYAIYHAHDDQAQILDGNEPQLGLQEFREVTTSQKLAQRVQRKLEDISEKLPRRVYLAWLSRESGIEQALLAYIRLSVEQDLDPRDQRYRQVVRQVMNAERKVGYDAYRYQQFIRFIRVGQNIYLADIEPDYDILLLLSGLFTDRLEGQRFLIRDKKRGKCLVWDMHRFWISYDPELLAPPTPGISKYEQLWQTYFTHIAIPERINPKLQTKLVPKRYRKYMTEFSGIKN